MAKRRWQRSRDAVAGGVCAGLADVIGVDAAVVRILVVLLSLMTVGVGAVAYLVLWAVLPLAPAEPSPLDVEPHAATSETYGAIDVAANEAAAGTSSAADVSARRDVYAAAGHVPPQPPLAAQAAAAAVASRIAAGSAFGGEPPVAAPQPAAHPAAEAVPHPAEAAPAPASAAPAAPAVPISEASRPAPAPKPRRRPTLSPVVRSLLLWACFAVAFVGLLRLMGLVVQGTSWWRFWPLFFVLSGIAVMAVPGKQGLRMAHAVTGWFLVVAGSVVLPMSVGLVRWASLAAWTTALWPLAVFAVAFLAIAWARRQWLWALGAGVLFTAFCLLGLVMFAEPGEVPSVVLDLPLGRAFEITYPFA